MLKFITFLQQAKSNFILALFSNFEPVGKYIQSQYSTENRYINSQEHSTYASIKLFIDDVDINRCRKCISKEPAGIFLNKLGKQSKFEKLMKKVELLRIFCNVSTLLWNAHLPLIHVLFVERECFPFLWKIGIEIGFYFALSMIILNEYCDALVVVQ